MRPTIKLNVLLLGTLACIVSSCAANDTANGERAHDTAPVLQARQASCSAQESISTLSVTEPIGAADEVLKIPNVLDPNEGLWDYQNIVPGRGIVIQEQMPWARGAALHLSPIALGDYENGYFSLPQFLTGFKLNRTMPIRTNGDDTAIVPFYVNDYQDAEKIERAVIVIPGQWRDSWSYINIIGNAYNIARKYPELDVKKGSVLMLSPVFFNQKDQERGALNSDEIYFEDSGWAVAGTTRGPSGFKGISSFSVIDHFVNYALNSTNFPNIKHVVIAGHSMGGQTVQRYAIMRKSDNFDGKISYWVGSPGSYMYLDDNRPMSGYQSNCSDYNEYPYGLDGTPPSYATSDFRKKNKLLNRFKNRRVHYSYGMDDNGGTSEKCAFQAQGPNRLSRGAYWLKSLESVFGGFPKSHTADFATCISHQDYPMMSHYESLKFIISSKSD